MVREYLAGMPEVEIVAECANGFEAVKAVAELRPDLLLLDVQMPKLNGFEVLDLVGRDVAVVFVTAFDQYALRAFEVHAVDYLLKPFSAERLAAAIARARERAGRGEKVPVRALAETARTGQGFAGRILVRDGPRVHVIPVATIDYVQAQDDYVCFRCGGKGLFEGADACRRRSVARSGAVRAHPPIVRPESGLAWRGSSPTRATTASPCSQAEAAFPSAAPDTHG